VPMLQADSVDVLRSLSRWIGGILPATYDVQPVRVETAERPSAIVRAVAPMPTGGRSAYVREWQRDYEVFIYPPGVEGDAFASLIEAEQLATSLMQVIEYGGAGSYTMRLPTFNYSDIPLSEGQLPGAKPFDHLPMSNVSVDVRVDPEDDTLYTLVLDLRVSWSRDGDTRRFGRHVPPVPGAPAPHDEPTPGDAPILTDVRTRYADSG
jgi:hypothetical protein